MNIFDPDDESVLSDASGFSAVNSLSPGSGLIDDAAAPTSDYEKAEKKMKNGSEPSETRLIVPPLAWLYAGLHDFAETLLRVVAGAALVTHGLSKIADPFGSAGMAESLGFYPGAFWSLMLSLTEFVGGILITIGFLTRPAALAAMVVLLVTVWFHWITLGQGYTGAEKSILWTTIFFLFVIRGGNRHSVDARIGRAF